MSTRTVLIGMGLVGLGVALCGCQQPLCPTGEDFAKAKQYKQAVDAYVQCRDTEKKRERIDELNKRIKDLTPKIVEPVLSKWEHPPTTLPQYEEAISDLEGVRSYDEHDPPWGIANRIAAYETARQKLKSEVQELLRKATDGLDKHRWKEAVECVDGAMAKDPEKPDMKELRRRILSGRDAYYAGEVAALCQKKQWREAAGLLKDFAAEAPQPQADVVQTLTRQVEQTKTMMVRAELQNDIDNKSYYRAYVRLVKDQPAGCGDLKNQIEREGWRYYQDQAEKMKRDANDFYAYVTVVKASKLPRPSPRAPEDKVFDLGRNYADFVDGSIRTEICIAAFDSPASDAILGKEFADRLATDLYRQLPYGLHLDDRRRVEYARTQVGENVRDALQLVGVSWAVQGSLSMSFVKDRQESEQPKWVPVKKTITNPHFDAEIEALRTQYGKDQSKWPRQPAHTITEELTEQVTYKTGIERMEGEIAVSVNIYSNAEGAITQSESFRIARDVNDTFSAGLAQVNIPPDRLEMISELSFKEQLEREMRKKVVDWLLQSFGQREKKFLKEAQYYIDRREYGQAVEAAAKGYFYCLKANVSEGDTFRKLEEIALLDLTEYPQRTPSF